MSADPTARATAIKAAGDALRARKCEEHAKPLIECGPCLFVLMYLTLEGMQTSAVQGAALVKAMLSVWPDCECDHCEKQATHAAKHVEKIDGKDEEIDDHFCEEHAVSTLPKPTEQWLMHQTTILHNARQFVAAAEAK